MGRTDFDRTPFAQSTADWEDFIPAIPDGPVIDENSPLAETEVRFDDDENARRRSIYLDFHNNNGEQELEIVAGFNSVRRELLNEALKEKTAVHGAIKTIAVTMAIQNARAHALFFTQNEFKRVADRSRTTWTYVCDIEEQKLRKKERPRAKRVVDIKPDPKPTETELKPLMTAEQYADKAAELEKIRAQIAEIDRAGIS